MPGIDDLVLELRDAAAHAARIAACCSPEALAKRPSPRSWSAAECVEHLNLTTRAYLPRLRDAYAELRQGGLRGEGPYRAEPMARLLHWMLSPPARLRLPTTPPFQPVMASGMETALHEFQQLQQQLLDLLEEGRGLAIDRARIVSPFSSSLRYNVYAAFSLIAVHQRRHLWQAEHALATPHAPALTKGNDAA
jgi:hypothetical protein